MTDQIRIEGLREFQAALKQLDGQSQKQLRVVLNSASALVVAGAKARAPVVTGAFRDSIRSSSTQREARVSGGSAKVPYFGFIEYGGAAGKHHSVHRAFNKDGRTVYPTYYAHRPEILEQLSTALTALIHTSGLETG